jgi:hypothetical protein
MSEYVTIEANNATYIMNEDMAINLYHAMSYQFDWAGSFFTASDVREAINERRTGDDNEPLAGDELEEAVNTILESRDWNRFLTQWMTEQGWEVINTAIHEHLEQEDN